MIGERAKMKLWGGSIERVNVDAELDWLGGAGNFGS